MLHWKLVRQRALVKQSHRTGGGNEERILAKQTHAAAPDERPRRYAPSGTAEQSRCHVVMAGLVPIDAKIRGPRAFCSLAPHPKGEGRVGATSARKRDEVKLRGNSLT